MLSIGNKEAWLFYVIGNFVHHAIKTLREDAHKREKREKKRVAKATALGARVSQAKLFVLFAFRHNAVHNLS